MTTLGRMARLAPLVFLLGGPAVAEGPRYAANGDLIPPTDYREWVFMSSGLDMSYTNAPAMPGGSMFDNVFVDPNAWRVFKATGHWPDKTVFVLETRGGTTAGSINKHGHYQTQELMGVEAHVRDEARFKGGWAFLALNGTAPAKQIPYTEQCYSCHQKNGAVGTTFTQFYPTARAIAVKAGTYLDR